MIKRAREIKNRMQEGWNLFTEGNKVTKAWLSMSYRSDAKPVALSAFYSLKHADEIELYTRYNNVSMWKLREG